MGKHEILPKRLDYLEVHDSACQFRINVDVLNEAFGAKESLYMKAGWPRDPKKYISGANDGEKFRIWLPKLFGKKDWTNSISSDGTLFYEDAGEGVTEDWLDDDDSGSKMLSVVFVQERRSTPYKFVGVFKAREMKHLHHTYERVATKVKLIGNPVRTIEIIE